MYEIATTFRGKFTLFFCLTESRMVGYLSQQDLEIAPAPPVCCRRGVQDCRLTARCLANRGASLCRTVAADIALASRRRDRDQSIEPRLSFWPLSRPDWLWLTRPTRTVVLTLPITVEFLTEATFTSCLLRSPDWR